MDTKNVELTDIELKTILEILNYTLENCPYEAISDHFEINQDVIEKIILKIKDTLI